jgi:hypothetical protein
LLRELEEEKEMIQLEEKIGSGTPLTVEEIKRLSELKGNLFNRLRSKLTQKHPHPFTYDEANTMRELLNGQFKNFVLSPLEVHRYREQLKRNNLFS